MNIKEKQWVIWPQSIQFNPIIAKKTSVVDFRNNKMIILVNGFLFYLLLLLIIFRDLFGKIKVSH